MKSITIALATSLLVLLLIISSLNFTIGSVETTTQTINDAESALNQAYQTTSKAEKAGAYISDLVQQLNEASSRLTRSIYLYNRGDYENAALLADQSRGWSSNIIEAANARIKPAQNINQENYSDIAILSFLVIIFTLFLSSIIWLRFKNYYNKVLTKKKPVVNSNGS